MGKMNSLGVVGTLGIQNIGKTLIVKAATAYVNTVFTAKAANAPNAPNAARAAKAAKPAKAGKAGKAEVSCGQIYLYSIYA